MKCYIISYDLRNLRNYDSLYKAIKSYGTWAKITESTWGVVTSQSAVQIRTFLLNHMDNDDRVFVIKSGSEAAWVRAICEDSWLKNNLIKS